MAFSFNLVDNNSFLVSRSSLTERKRCFAYQIIPLVPSLGTRRRIIRRGRSVGGVGPLRTRRVDGEAVVCNARAFHSLFIFIFASLDQALLLFLFLIDASITAHKESKNGKARPVLVYHDLETKRN
jgi:hypothetical protein